MSMKSFTSVFLVILMITTCLFAQSPNVKFDGDFRFRHQTLMVDDMTTVGNQAVRFRMNMEAVADSHFSVNARLVTGTDSPLSNESNVRFGKSDIFIDRIYVTYRACDDALKVHGGKMPVPFVYTPIHFDPDLNFDGFAAQYNKNNLFVNAGGFWINEASAPANQGLIAAQVGTHIASLDLAAAYYHYVNLKDHALLYDISNSFGNTATGGMYSHEYEIVDVNIGAALSMFYVSANYINNISVDENNTAWIAGADADLKYVMLGAYYCVLEADAIVAAFADDEPGGGTDLNGILATAYLTPSKNTKIGGKYYNSTVLPDTPAEFTDQRLLLDFELIW